MIPDHLRGQQRAELAQQLADRCRARRFTVTVLGLAVDIDERAIREHLRQPAPRTGLRPGRLTDRHSTLSRMTTVHRQAGTATPSLMITICRERKFAPR